MLYVPFLQLAFCSYSSPMLTQHLLFLLRLFSITLLILLSFSFSQFSPISPFTSFHIPFSPTPLSASPVSVISFSRLLPTTTFSFYVSPFLSASFFVFFFSIIILHLFPTPFTFTLFFTPLSLLNSFPSHVCLLYFPIQIFLLYDSSFLLSSALYPYYLRLLIPLPLLLPFLFRILIPLLSFIFTLPPFLFILSLPSYSFPPSSP